MRVAEYGSPTQHPSAAERLDRLPVTSFHYRLLGLIGAGLFLDAFEIYLAGGVLGALLKEGWSPGSPMAKTWSRRRADSHGP